MLPIIITKWNYCKCYKICLFQKAFELIIIITAASLFFVIKLLHSFDLMHNG